VNPDGQEGILNEAFTYSPNMPDWGQLAPPTTLSAYAGVGGITLSAEVYEAGITEEAGAGFSLVAEVGYGPLGSLPEDEGAWTWQPAFFSHDINNNDVWEGSVSAPEGQWSAAMRFSLGSNDTWLIVDLDGTNNGVAADQLPTLSFTQAPSVAITALTPNTSWPLGGMSIRVEGLGLSEACTLELQGEALESEWKSEALYFTAPAGELGDAALTLTCPEGEADATLSYVDSWDGALNEWPEDLLLANNELESEWTEDNTLRALYVTHDATHLYIAIDGECSGLEGANALLLYIDTDFGEGTGLTDTSTLTDSDHPVDDALGGVLSFTASGFGAEFAFASLNMMSYVPGAGDPAESMAGWRALSPADDLPWLTSAALYASGNAIEAMIPLEELLGPPSGLDHTLAFIARISNADGGYLANQALPSGVAGDANEVAPEATSITLTF